MTPLSPAHLPILKTSISKRLLLVLIAGLVLSIIGHDSLALQPLPRKTVANEEGFFEDVNNTKEDSPRIATRKKMLVDGLFRNRRHQILLGRAKVALQKGNDILALKHLQYLMSLGHDYFVWNEKTGVIGSLRDEVDELISSPSVLKQYEQKYGEEATQLLQDATTANDFGKYHQVSQQYYFTKAGFQAVDVIATRQFDRGYFGEAARMWQGLISANGHRKRITSQLRLKTALAWTKSGDKEAAISLAKTMGRQPVFMGGQKYQPAEIAALLQSNRLKSVSPLKMSDWRMTGGSLVRHRSSDASTPFLKANWVSNFEKEEDQQLSKSIAKWEQKQQAKIKPIAAQTNAIVVGNRLIVRTYRDIICNDLATGKMIWKFRNNESMGDILDKSAQFNEYSSEERYTAVQVSLLQRFTGNGISGHLTADSHHVYAIDDSYLMTYGLSHRTTNLSKPERITNRLIALSVSPEQQKQQHHTAIRPELKWSVGGNASIPTWFYQFDRNGDSSISRTEYIGSKDQFQKYDTNSDQEISKAEVIASSPEKNNNPLAGHLFLGPPLPVEDRLFVMTYAEGSISLAVLHAQTGRLISLQGMIFLPGQFEEHTEWMKHGVKMTFSSGMIICPVLPNLLVGVDATRGKLLWVSDILNELYVNTNQPVFSPSVILANRKSHTHPGYPALPLIDGDRIYYLPRTSRTIYCLDLSTGKKIWTALREDAQYIGAVTKNTLFVVGNLHYKSLSKKTGEQLWQKGTSIPSGIGVFTGKHYLLPLQEGHVATIDVLTGEKKGFALLPNDPIRKKNQPSDNSLMGKSSKSTHWSPGNLIAAGHQIISTNLHETAAFPQVNLLRRELAFKQLNSNMTPQDHLVLSELDLLSGNTSQTRIDLKSLTLNQLNPLQLARANRIQRELLYLELKEQTSNSNAILMRLDRLSRSPQERSRFLMKKGEFHLQQKDFQSLISTISEYAKLPKTKLVQVEDDPMLSISARSWIPAILSRANQLKKGNLIQQNRPFALKQMQKVLASNNPQSLQQFLSVFDSWAEAATVRSQLAKLVIAQGKFQQAEFLLLTNQKSDSKEIAADATYQLFKLYQQLGLESDAASMLWHIHQHHQAVRLPNHLTGKQFLAQFAQDSVIWNRYQQHRPVTWKVTRATIKGKGWMARDPHIQQTFDKYRFRILKPASSPFELHVKQQYAGRTLNIVDRATGTILGDITTPYNHNWIFPQPVHFPSKSHFIPVGSSHGMVGVSLLQMKYSQPLWKVTPTQFSTGSEFMQVGPSGNSFATFQSQHKLIVVDPATGEILWERKNLSAQCGLHFSTSFGLFGDEKALVMFHGSYSKEYTVYNTLTGEEIHSGSLLYVSTPVPKVFGRKLLCKVDLPFQKRDKVTKNQYQVVLWDPLEAAAKASKKVTEIPSAPLASGTALTGITPENDLVVFDKQRLKIFNQMQSRPIVDIFLPIYLQTGHHIQAFRNGNVYLVNVRQHSRPQNNFNRFRFNGMKIKRVTQNDASDTLIPSLSGQGVLFVIDVKQQRLLWQQNVNQITILQTPKYPLPFFITLSRIRDRNLNNQQSLTISLIDCHTGQTIGQNRNIINDRLVQMTYRKAEGRIELYGIHSQINIDFSRKQQSYSPFK